MCEPANTMQEHSRERTRNMSILRLPYLSPCILFYDGSKPKHFTPNPNIAGETEMCIPKKKWWH